MTIIDGRTTVEGRISFADAPHRCKCPTYLIYIFMDVRRTLICLSLFRMYSSRIVYICRVLVGLLCNVYFKSSGVKLSLRKYVAVSGVQLKGYNETIAFYGVFRSRYNIKLKSISHIPVLSLGISTYRHIIGTQWDIRSMGKYKWWNGSAFLHTTAH